jgi:hypothetical protein
VGDGRTERAGGGALGIDMNPLIVPGGIGVGVDVALGDLDPRALPELGPGVDLEEIGRSLDG